MRVVCNSIPIEAPLII